MTRENKESRFNFPTINWKGYALPDWMFAEPDTNTDFVSPAASFKPNAALSGSGWKSSTTPDRELVPKKLVIDSIVYVNGLDTQDVIAQIEWLKSLKIDVYLCIRQNGANKIVDCANNNILDDCIGSIREFDVSDYEALATEYKISRSNAAALTSNYSEEMFECLTIKKRYIADIECKDRATAEKSLRLVDRAAYEAYIPSIIKTDERPKKIVPVGRLNAKPKLDASSSNELLELIIKQPFYIYQLLENNSELIDESFTIKLFQSFPVQRSVTMPLCYDKIGMIDLSPLPTHECVEYLCSLNTRLDAADLPLDKNLFDGGRNALLMEKLFQLLAAYPQLGQ